MSDIQPADVRLEKILSNLPQQLMQISEEAASKKTMDGKWSKKEILGHLIDSASNNHQRFIRLQLGNDLALWQYQQAEWVETQKYNERPWKEIVSFWKEYNLHLLHVIRHLNRDTLQHTGTFPDYGKQSLQFIIDDYVDHLIHHIKQIL